MALIPIWIKLAVLGAILAGLVTACHHRDYNLIESGRVEQRTVDQAAADKLKAEARALLDAETAKVRTRQDLLTNIVMKAQVTREQAQTANAAAVSVPRVLRITVPASECRPSGVSTATAPSAAASDAAPATVTVQLPERVSGDLSRLMGKAQSILIDYRVLYDYVNRPDLVCELRQ